MLAYLNPNESLTAVMGGSAATTNPTYSAMWRQQDGKETNNPVGSLSGATAVTVVSAPAAGQKEVIALTIYNGDTADVTVTVSKVVGGTSYTLFSKLVPTGNILRVTSAGVELVSTSTPANVGTAAGAGVSASEQGNGIVQRTVLSLVEMPVTVGNTTGVSFGGTKFYDFPAGRILILGVTVANVSFDLTDAGNATPIAGTHGGDFSIGTTAPSDGTLTNADVDLLPSTSIDPISGGVAGAALAASAQFDGTTAAVDAYFNILIDDADVGDGASDVLLVNATITIHWILLGDY